MFERHRVLFVSVVDLAGSSGQNIATRELLRALGGLDHVKLGVVYASSGGALPKSVAGHTSWSAKLPEPGPGSVAWHVRLQGALVTSVLRGIKEFDPDVVVARLGPSLFVPPIVASIRRVPYALLIRGMGGWENQPLVYRLGRPIASLAWAINVRAADRVFVAFSEIKGKADAVRGPGRRQAVIVPNGVDPSLFRPLPIESARSSLAALRLPPGAFVVGFVGSLKPRHRVDLLIGAFASHVRSQNAQLRGESILLVVGDGPERAGLEEQAQKLGVADRIRFAGHVDHGAVNTYMAAADVLAAVVDPEDLSNPIKCYEYLACGRPVVISEKQEFEFVAREELGVTVSVNTVAAFAAGITQVAALSHQERKRMGGRARDQVVKSHTWEARARRIVKELS